SSASSALIVVARISRTRRATIRYTIARFRPSGGTLLMQARTRISIALVGAAVASTILSAADYTITVSQDRLNNALNEPQNWLLMNGDYGATRYSKLTQINRENVKNLRMVWAM